MTVSGQIVVFVHVPKTAGTTVLRILEREYGADALLTLYDSTFGDELSTLPAARLAGIRAVAGHFYFGVHQDTSLPCRYFTFLRDPVERIVSHYHFVRGQPDHYLHGAATRLGLREYVEVCGGAEPNNDQTRLLAGRNAAPADGISSPEMLPAAKLNLERHDVVGLTEAFDASLLLLQRSFGWRAPFYRKQNVSRPGRARRLDGATREAIFEYNALDLELYRHARERFEQQLAEAGGERFARQVRRFTRLNTVYGGVHRFGSAAKRRLVPTA